VRVFIVFRDTIYASGLKATLAAAPEVESVELATSIALAWEHQALEDATLIVLDNSLGGAAAFVQDISLETSARILVCVRDATSEIVLEVLNSGAGGVLTHDQLTPETLLGALTAMAAGVVALDAGAVQHIARAADGSEPQRSTPPDGRFTAREQMVLRLVAAGLSNREIAERLSYSERTIKTILHDVVTKLGVKSRSHAVAMAVRERMI
jgi:DNA-binding NarL/FixJ family response regulator